MKGLMMQPAKAQWLHELAKDPARLAALNGDPQTRRVMKDQPPEDMSAGFWYPRIPRSDKDKTPRHYAHDAHWRKGGWIDFAPHKPGDRLYVKEPWQPNANFEHDDDGSYEIIRATFKDGVIRDLPSDAYATWERRLIDHERPTLGYWQHPHIMPEWAARTILTITKVRAERARDIPVGDLWLEGIDLEQEPFSSWFTEAETAWATGHPMPFSCPEIYPFYRHFIKLNGKDAWDKWVWVYDVNLEASA